MSITRTIGGNRLGTGKKMSVTMKSYERSTHDLSYIWRSSQAPGTLVPFMSEVGLPGDTFDIDLECEILTHPTVGPLFGSFKVQLDVFMIPIRLYNAQLHNNKLGIGLNMNAIRLPQLVFSAPNPGAANIDIDNAHTNPSSILAYLNIRGIGNDATAGNAVVTRLFNAVPYLGYWDIYKNYYANKQEELGAVIRHTLVSPPPPLTEPQVGTFPLSNIDLMREQILQWPGGAAFEISGSDVQPYDGVFRVIGAGSPAVPYVTAATQPLEGLALKTYQSDLFNNWIRTEWLDGSNGINEITRISTSAGSFKLDTLLLAKKVYDMLNRIAISGGTYNDWIDTVYTHERYVNAETPMYMGGLIKELVFQEVISNSETTAQPLGTLGGRGKLTDKNKGGKVRVSVEEPCYIMGIISLTPRLDYSQGNKWDVNLKSLDDLHKPGLDQIGFQSLITDQMAWWDTLQQAGDPTYYSAGKQPAWINYMTNVNRTYGNFAIADNEMFMTLNRRYDVSRVSGIRIRDLTTYIDPVNFNHIFAETSRDAQNFWTQIGVNITARRKMSAKIMPNL